jgi:phosphate transport system substrate-binding protein
MNPAALRSSQSVLFPTLSLLGLFLISTNWLIACGTEPATLNAQGNHSSCATPVSLVGAGSTFDAPLFNAMFTMFAQTTCQISVTYHANGSGAGINALIDQNVDFAATDVPMTDTGLARSTNGPILHIPMTLGTEAIVYHLPGVSVSLRLTGPVLANIYLASIRFWDDPAIQALNPGVALPHEAIMVVHRLDGSGTTGIFTRYLSIVSQQWKQSVGSSVIVNWPIGGGYQGNGGVAKAVESLDGAIGYVELSYALALHLPSALLQNATGAFVAPFIAGAQAAASTTTNIPSDLRFYLVNAPGRASYPISGYSRVIVYQHQTDEQKGMSVATLFWWMIHAGQQEATPLHYAPLPATMVSRSEVQIRAITCGNHPCFPA